MTTTARVIGKRLHASGVRYVMGHPGGEVIDLIEGFREEGLDFVLTKHETAAGFMADAIGSCTGIPGVALGTLGPGATNLVTGVAHAHLDRSPMVAITGQLPVDRYETTTHQKLDLGALFTPITKWHARVTAANAGVVTERAIRVASSHRPGPVFLEIPSDVPRQTALDGMPHDPVTVRAARFDTGAGDRAAELLKRSARPVLLAGMDALSDAAAAAILRLVQAWSIPVMVGPKAKGVFREDHPLFVGTIEMLGTGKLYEFIDGCDLVIMAGLEPVELDRDWSAAAPVIHIGPLPNDDLYYHATVEMVGPVELGLAVLHEAARAPSTAQPREDVVRFRREFREFVTPTRDGMTAQSVLATLRRALPEEAIVTCDVGFNKAVTGQCWPAYQPRTFFMSNGLSSMGYGLPAALGLQLVHPGRRVACVLGDGGFAMLLAEVETAVRRALPVLIVVLADEALSQIKIGQERRGLPATGTTFGKLDYVALARAFGACGREVSTPKECAEAFAWAATTGKPTIVAAHIDPTGYVL